MKKLMILPLIMALSAADFGAFAAAPRGGRNTGGNSAGAAAPKANGARAAQMGGKVVNTGAKTKTTGTANAAAPKANGARAAQMGGKVANPAAKTKTTGTANAAAPKANGARAAATQKAIKMGTKVSAATENTTVSKECQDAYYGCMDSFCMLDNASGGRCQCNDRITELDAILAEIMKLDEQSMTLATEGVEKVQMGELADQINERAKSIESEHLVKEKKEETKKKTLDLSAWNNSSMFADDEENVFGEEKQDDFKIADDLANKKGDELHKSAAKICTQQIPAECKASASMLQMTYAQKIRSDCTGYENSLKQKKTESAQKLQTAKKAVKEALLDEEKNKNKYEDLGSCVVAFKQCMQTTGECGTDFSGCVADTAILSALYGKGTKSSSKVQTTQIKTGATVVTISSATYDILQNKAQRCESVVRQCQNANGGKTIAGGKVLGEFMKDVALVVYNTEYARASDSRMNCMTTIINCVKKSCKSAGMDEGTDNYDACLSNPDSIKNYCSLEIKRCGDLGSENDVIAYVQAKLAADRVDKCTQEVKDCLQSEDRCGEDYAGCVGLTVNQILRLCPIEKLIACQNKFSLTDKGKEEANQYIENIIMGLKLNISNGLAGRCQEAIDAAMEKVCGATDSCDNLTLNNVSYNLLSAKICKTGTTNCYDSANSFDQQDIIKGLVAPRLTNRLDVSRVRYDSETGFSYDTNNINTNYGFGSNVDTSALIGGLNQLFKSKISELSVSPAVTDCINGKNLTGIFPTANNKNSKNEKGQETETEMAMPNLLDGAKTIIANRIQSLFAEEYKNKEEKIKEEQFQPLYDSIYDRLSAITNMSADDFYVTQQKLCEQRAEEINRNDNTGVSTGRWQNDTNASANNVTRDPNAECTANGGFCTLGSEYFFDTWWGRNERRQALFWTIAKFDSEKSICYLTKTKYTCKDYRTSPEICAEWDTTGVQDSVQEIQMPKFNDERMR